MQCKECKEQEQWIVDASSAFAACAASRLRQALRVPEEEAHLLVCAQPGMLEQQRLLRAGRAQPRTRRVSTRAAQLPAAGRAAGARTMLRYSMCSRLYDANTRAQAQASAIEASRMKQRMQQHRSVRIAATTQQLRRAARRAPPATSCCA